MGKTGRVPVLDMICPCFGTCGINAHGNGTCDMPLITGLVVCPW